MAGVRRPQLGAAVRHTDGRNAGGTAKYLLALYLRIKLASAGISKKMFVLLPDLSVVKIKRNMI